MFHLGNFIILSRELNHLLLDSDASDAEEAFLRKQGKSSNHLLPNLRPSSPVSDLDLIRALLARTKVAANCPGSVATLYCHFFVFPCRGGCDELGFGHNSHITIPQPVRRGPSPGGVPCCTSLYCCEQGVDAAPAARAAGPKHSRVLRIFLARHCARAAEDDVPGLCQPKPPAAVCCA